ncbi:hypothetical protein Tco_0524385 [Tanacetum coccineum]
MADKGKKSSMETFAPNDKADYYSGITSITVNGKNAYELKGNILDDLHNNAFSGINEKDAVEHIEYYLKIIDPIKLPNVDHDKLRVVIFPISLVGGARRCDKEEKTTEIFEIENDVFDYETPLYLAFNEFNYLLKVDPDLLTNDIMGFKTYGDYKDDWIYEENKNVPWVYDKPWLDNGIWREPKPVKHTCKPFNYKTRYLEWYEALKDSKLKDKALRNKAIIEGLISDDESNNDCWKRWTSHEIYCHDYDEGEYDYETHEEGHELCSIKTREVPDLGSKEISTNISGEFTNLEILKCCSLENFKAAV